MGTMEQRLPVTGHKGFARLETDASTLALFGLP